MVDMPGYGFAKAPKDKVDALDAAGLRLSARPRRGCAASIVLIDARHGLKANDEEVLDLLDKAAVSYQIVLTKMRQDIGPGSPSAHRRHG